MKALAIGAAAVALVACHDDEPATRGDAAPMVAQSQPSAPTLPSGPRIHQGPVPHLLLAPCRAIAVEGDARTFDETRDAGGPVTISEPLPGAPWIDLDAGARVTVKDPRTMRETALVGPGRARACVDRVEEVWLARGAVEASPGAGDSPGAEEWIATASGVARVSASRVRVEADDSHASIVVASGGASVWRADDARASFGADAGPATPADDGWIRVSTEAPLALSSGPASVARARSVVAKCEAASAESKSLSAQIADGGPLSDLAPKDVRARSIWRAACAVARVAVAGLSPKDRGPLDVRVSAAAPARQAR